MWDKITLFQYQQLVPALQEQDATEQNCKIIAILNNWTEHQVDSLTVEAYNKEKDKLKFLNEQIGGKPVKYIEVNGRRYRCVYDIRKLPAARYIESKVFSQDFVGNLHKLAASMVIPQRRYTFGWKDAKYDASKHEEYAQDMLSARFIDVYHSIVFFYQVYRNWMQVSKDYLIQQLAEKMTMEEARKEVQNLLVIMDGNIAPNLLPTTKIAQLAKHMNYQQSNT
jgi:hypothetical protein